MQKFIRLRQTQNWCFKMKIKCGRKGVEKGHMFFLQLKYCDFVIECKTAKKTICSKLPKINRCFLARLEDD